MKFDSKKFGFKFFLSDRVKINNLEQAAREHGGATHNLEENEMFSNVPGSEFISIQNGNTNTFSVYIPDTTNINEKASKEELKNLLQEVMHRIYDKYGMISPAFERGLGSWYSEELMKVVYDNIVIATVQLDFVTIADIRFFISLAKFIKKQMKQEAVTLAINTAMALI